MNSHKRLNWSKLAKQVTILLCLVCSQASANNDDMTIERETCENLFSLLRQDDIFQFISTIISEKDINRDRQIRSKTFEVLGTEGYGLLKPENMSEMLEPGILTRLKVLKERFARKGIDFQKAALSLSPKNLLRYEDAIVRLATASKGDETHTFESFRIFLERFDVDFLVRLTEILNRSPEISFIHASTEAISNDPDLFLEIAKLLAYDFEKIVPYLKNPLVKSHRVEILTLIKDHPLSAAGLLKAFKKDAFQIAHDHDKTLQKIEYLTGTGANDFVANLPVERWNDPEVLAAADFYGEDTADMYKLSQLKKEKSSVDFDWLTAYLTPLFQLNRNLFGIEHFSQFSVVQYSYFRRRVTDIEFPVLAANLKNLDSKYQSQKPIALHIYAKDDWNHAFRKRVAEQTKALTKKYKVFVVEVRRKEEISEHMQRIASLSGYTLSKQKKRTFLKPINLLILNAHANSVCLLLNMEDDTEVQLAGEQTLTHSRVTIKDKKLFNEWLNYMGGALPTCLITGCNTANLTQENHPILHVMADRMPGIRFVGAMAATYGWKVKLKNDETYDDFYFPDVPHVELIH